MVAQHKAFLLQWGHGLELEISFFPPNTNSSLVEWTYLARCNTLVFFFYLCRLSTFLILTLYRDYYTISITALNYYAISISYSYHLWQEEGEQWLVCSKSTCCCSLQKHKGWKVYLALPEQSEGLLSPSLLCIHTNHSEQLFEFSIIYAKKSYFDLETKGFSQILNLWPLTIFSAQPTTHLEESYHR